MIFLTDNGSLRVEAYHSLCSIAQRLSSKIGQTVVPAPLLHANRIPADQLNGTPAAILEEKVKVAYDSGGREFDILPLFLGPSGALIDYLPRRLRKIAQERPGFEVRILKPLFVSKENGGAILTSILSERVSEVASPLNSENFQVVLVDHGSPRREVTQVRNQLAKMLSSRLNRAVIAASMERRIGTEYDFNEPLLEKALKELSSNPGPCIVAQLFLSPGRHAGPGGDIEAICLAAENQMPGLVTARTELLASHPALDDLLYRRLQEREEISPLNLSP